MRVRIMTRTVRGSVVSTLTMEYHRKDMIWKKTCKYYGVLSSSEKDI